MAIAFENDKFAVVDLETTGTQREHGDRIIQFGCAIIKNRKVVKTYSFLINPHHNIPQSVENLTGIKNDDVKDAHDFSYYAKRIRKILQDTIFVAHNINFDLPFLNYELVKAGLEPLRGKAIDTVELAQIAFPTYPSYKLKDLTARLNIKHLNPHRADSDALVTAKLLLKIIKRLEQLPTATLNTLTALSKGLLRDTDYIFYEISQYARQLKRPLAKDQIQVRNLILQRQELPQPNLEASENKFPLSDSEKKQLFKGQIRYRKGQTALINRIHDFIEHDKQDNLIVEAPNGSGKTLAYLMAYAYELYSGRKLVIATPTKVLQEQIYRQEIPQLIKITGLDLFAQEVKSSTHYLDLDGFYNSLYQRDYDQQTLVWQMEILVWLTQTTTGDLDELQLTNYNNPFFDQIQHPGDARVGTYFSDYDFWNLARQRQELADILITNHAYLANHFMDSIWGQNPFLVVDEAHRFTENVTSSRSDGIQFESFWGSVSHLRNLLLFGPVSVKEKFGNQQEFGLILEQLESEIKNLIHAINHVQENLYGQIDLATSRVERRQNRVDFGFQGQDLFPHPDQMKGLLNQIQTSIEKVRQETNQILFLLYQQEHLVNNNDELIQELREEIDQLDFYAEQTYLLIDQLNNSNVLAEKGFILQVTDITDPLSTNIIWMMLDPSEELKQLYQYFSKRLFISATSMNNNSFDFIEKNLSLNPQNTLTYQGKASFKIEKHLKVLALDDPSKLGDPNDENYAKFIATFLKEALEHQKHVLVLFTNLETIKDVFTEIINDPSLKDYEILAQGLTGSNQRIAKRFGIADKAILLGANSFWEGIDFKNNGVDLALAVKLPFESPDNPEVKLREERIKNQLKNKGSIFELDTLPRALIRFRQGAGRLIRNERDHGTFVILDQRIWHKNYGQEFLNALPVGTKKVNYQQLISLLKEENDE